MCVYSVRACFSRSQCLVCKARVKREDTHTSVFQVVDGLSPERGAWSRRKRWVGQWVELKGHFRTKSESDFPFPAEAGCCLGSCKENRCVDGGVDWMDCDSFHSVSLLG